MNDPLDSAYEILRDSVMTYQGRPVGTVAACDPAGAVAANYHDCFVRDFIPSALVFLADGETEIVRNFLTTVVALRSQHKAVQGHEREPAVLPASFRVTGEPGEDEQIRADFGDHAIGRVAPVDSMMWWVILLGIYVRRSGDRAFAERPRMQEAIRAILALCLQEGFEVFPTLLVPDGAFMVDRRMGVYGHPLELQALFYGMLMTATELLEPTPETERVLEMTVKRTQMLRSYLRLFYWLDLKQLNEIHRYRTEEFGSGSVNMLNIYPESIPDWVVDWLPYRAGYLVGNLGPGRMDFRFFALGNLLSVLFGVTTKDEAHRIMLLYSERWGDLVGEMPCKIVYPTVAGKEWQFMTGSDPKNPPWSYHNGGNWPVLLWAFVAAALTTGRGDLAQHAIETAERSLPEDVWPEYYDGRSGHLIGRRAHLNQIWTVAGYIFARKLMDDASLLGLFPTSSD